MRPQEAVNAGDKVNIIVRGRLFSCMTLLNVINSPSDAVRVGCAATKVLCDYMQIKSLERVKIPTNVTVIEVRTNMRFLIKFSTVLFTFSPRTFVLIPVALFSRFFAGVLTTEIYWCALGTGSFTPTLVAHAQSVPVIFG
jgi:hypothetical protein